MAHAPALLAYLTGLPGLRVVATRSNSEFDSYVGYFVFKERLYALATASAGYTPTRLGIPIFHTRLVLSLRGQPPDEAAFAEVERHAQTYSPRKALQTLPAQLRFWFLPSTPRKVLLKYRSDATEAARPIRRAAAKAPATAGTDAVPEAGLRELKAGGK